MRHQLRSLGEIGYLVYSTTWMFSVSVISTSFQLLRQVLYMFFLLPVKVMHGIASVAGYLV